MKNSKKCKIEECDRIISSKKHELCYPHLYQYYRKGKVICEKVRIYKKHKPFVKETI